MKKILVTGATGLVGHFLLQELLQPDTSITALYNNTEPAFRHSQIQWVQADILDALVIRSLVAEVQEVYHCAGFVSYSPQDINLLQQINVEGTEHVVNACLDNPAVKLCHVSSIAAVNRKKGEAIIDEKATWDPGVERSVYAVSKHLAELEVWRGISEGLQAVIVNPSIILGPGDIGKSSTQLFKYIADERPFYTKGYANFVDVRDVVSSMLLLMEGNNMGERFILNGHQTTYHYFFTEVALAWGKKAPRVNVPGWFTEVLWRAEAIRGQVTGARPLITKETARIAKEKHFYSNQKVRAATGISFRPLEETIRWSCQQLAAKVSS